jgi:hypothetical protein
MELLQNAKSQTISSKVSWTIDVAKVISAIAGMLWVLHQIGLL